MSVVLWEEQLLLSALQVYGWEGHLPLFSLHTYHLSRSVTGNFHERCEAWWKGIFFFFPLKMSKKARGSKNALSAVGSLKCISGVTLA